MNNKALFPLSELSTVADVPKIAYATWSPTGHHVVSFHVYAAISSHLTRYQAYVMENDLYVSDLVESTRVTFDGSATVFNGVPDWVYEGKNLSHAYPKN